MLIIVIIAFIIALFSMIAGAVVDRTKSKVLSALAYVVNSAGAVFLTWYFAFTLIEVLIMVPIVVLFCAAFIYSFNMYHRHKRQSNPLAA